MRVALILCVAACAEPADISLGDQPPLAITATRNSTRFVTREHMLAAGEMQISGEPLATAMQRDLGAYSRDLLPPNLYDDPQLAAYWIDLPGFSTAVESYEYSKQPMNNLAFEAGAGTALAHAPLVEAMGGLAPLVSHFADGANAGAWVSSSGWPGMQPTAHVFASFDPAIDPTSAFALLCSISSDDDPGESGSLVCADYECDATTLHLRDRAAQVDPTITPGADGFSAWKYGLWTMNYLQIMHDANEAAVAGVAPGDVAGVGVANNQIVGVDASGAATAPGTYLGSSDIEGFQAQMFILELDARADDWLANLTTTDGVALSGFATTAEALAYDRASPLRWFPGAIGVTEAADGTPSYALSSPTSQLLDLVGIAMGYAELYALTDVANRDVGGASTARAFFDGDPFAATTRDRALAMLRVALVDLDRMHVDPASGLFVDSVTWPMRGHTISTTSAAYAVIGLRTALRSLGSHLELYSNNTPDSPVAATPLAGLDETTTVEGRMAQLVRAHADLLLDHLTDASGRAWSGWDVVAAQPIDDQDLLDAHTAAIRGLFAAFLATGDVRYRDRAIAVFDRVEAVFYDADARIYGEIAAPVTSVEYTPLRFALLQSALRDMYELVAARPGGAALEQILEDRLGRLNKLVLDGWDDRDRDQMVSTSECVLAPYPAGGLQMAERTLTGEIGRGKAGPNGPPTSDRDGDCVPEIDDAHLPAGLADSITFEVHR
jgi:hypothetical protein